MTKKKKVLTEFIQKVYADEEFQKFMSEMGMQAWAGSRDEILSKIEEQKDAMKDYMAPEVEKYGCCKVR